MNAVETADNRPAHSVGITPSGRALQGSTAKFGVVVPELCSQTSEERPLQKVSFDRPEETKDARRPIRTVPHCGLVSTSQVLPQRLEAMVAMVG